MFHILVSCDFSFMKDYLLSNIKNSHSNMLSQDIFNIDSACFVVLSLFSAYDDPEGSNVCVGCSFVARILIEVTSFCRPADQEWHGVVRGGGHPDAR